jgi:hypothetical protein
MKNIAVFSCLMAAGMVNANPAIPQEEASYLSPWHYGIGMGFTKSDDMIENEGQTVLGRLFIARDFKSVKNFDFGIELGFQTGNDSKLKMTSAQQSDLGNVPVQVFTKPMMDFLLTTSIDLDDSTSFIIKGGMAYRQIHFDRDTINSLDGFDPEIQLGIKTKISDNAALSIAYQTVMGGNSGFTTTNPSGAVGSGTANMKNIPDQNGIIITLGMRIN